ncbi:MAG: helix-turn-helix transcriptional regulator [Clostridia bacterium]|nr:helix-turn-helix transcriptional regulator [Clostridia bacterium]
MIGERLKEIRKDHKHTQQQLAELLKVSVSTVQSWEQDKSDPSHELLVAICRMYSASSDFLLGLTDDDPLFRKDDPLTPENHSALQRFKAFLLDNQNKK